MKVIYNGNNEYCIKLEEDDDEIYVLADSIAMLKDRFISCMEQDFEAAIRKQLAR